jgi:hypothetical protein
MTSTVAKPGALNAPPVAAASRSRGARRRALTLAGLTLTLAVLSVGTWLILARVSSRSANPASAATSASTSTPIASPWLERLEVIRLKKQLVRAGYSIEVAGNLDPVTKSALADYLQLDSTHPLSPFLAAALENTVITGFRDPSAWNSRFGLHRLTKFVERPLTGSGGQIDANGNPRATIAAAQARLQVKVAGSKDGKIAFVDRTNTLDVVNPNASALRRLAGCSAPITSCVSNSVAFGADSAGGIFVIDANANHRRKLSETASEITRQ